MADLHLYEVPHRNHTATLRLSEEDAKALYGDKAKKVGSVAETKPEPVAVPSHAVDPESDEKAAAAPRNKSRSAASSK